MVLGLGGANKQKSYKGVEISSDREEENFYPTSTELALSNLATLVWLMDVPRVGLGGLVGPMVPVAITP